MACEVSSNRGYPKIVKKPFITKFGNVKNELRGYEKDKLINPPIEVLDNYYWLRDDNRRDIEVLELIKDENRYTDDIVRPINTLKNKLYCEVKSYIQESYDTYKYKLDNKTDYLYFRRFIEGKDYANYMREKDKTEELLLDINKLSEGKKQCDVTSFSVSPDHKYISYGVDYDGSEKYEFVLKEIESENIIKTEIPKLVYCSYVWATNKLIYYLEADDANRLNKLWLYNLEDNSNIKLFEEINNDYDLSLDFSSDENYIIISSGNYDENYIQIIDIKNDEKKLVKFTEIESGLKYDIESQDEYFYIKTNKDNCTNWKLMRVLKEDLDINNWEEFIPYNDNVFIRSHCAFKNYIIFSTKINGNLYLNIINSSKDKIKVLTHIENKEMSWDEYINQDFKNLKSDNVYRVDLGVNCIYDTETINIIYGSMTSPMKYFDYNMDSLENAQVYEKIVPNYDENLYESKRVWIPQEGTQLGIPVSMIYRKDKYKQDGINPLYLYGYGSYGHTVEPDFDYEILPLLDAGYIYVIAHIRGGSFLGYNWYLDGKMSNKINTFKDFIRCAEYLGDESNKYCDPKKIVIEGRSAGGLLIGAVTVMRPDLFWIAIPGVPFVDVMNTMSDSKIPLTTEEWTQWGNPNEQEGYDNIREYCPYTNVKGNHYPNMYCTAGLHDPRVPYWEIIKLIAKIREYKKDNNIQMIRIETEQGHFGGSSRYKSIEELSEKYAFILSR